jgi:hypothetical protein
MKKTCDLAAVLDSENPERFFSQSPSPELRKLRITELELAEKAMGLEEIDPPEFVRRAVRMYATRLLSISARSGDKQSRGIRGGADDRIEAAFNEIMKSGETFTLSGLRVMASTNYQTVRRWVERHHPEILIKGTEKGYDRVRRRITGLYPDHVPAFEQLYADTRKGGEPVDMKALEANFIKLMEAEKVRSTAESIRPQVIGAYKRERKRLSESLKGSPFQQRVLRRFDAYFEKFVESGDSHAVASAKKEAASYLKGLQAKKKTMNT